jgi:hypothetical protein
LPLRAPVEAPVPVAPVAELSGATVAHPWVQLAKVSIRRAFRTRIEPGLVLADERAAMTLASPPIVDPNFQAFLAWRRSTLLLVAIGLALVTGLRFIELILSSDVPSAARAVAAIPIAADVALCALVWRELGHWVGWHRQRKVLTIAVIAAGVAPMVIGLLPIRTLVGGGHVQALGLYGSMHALILMVPITLALAPGLVRGATIGKLLFPGTSVPGWLMLIGAPLGPILGAAVLTPPLQLTGSGFFAATVLALVGGAGLTMRVGWQLARPLSAESNRAVIAQSRTGLLAANALAATFALLAIIELADQANLRTPTVLAAVAGVAIHVVLFALVTTDSIVAGLDHARRVNAGAHGLTDDHLRQIAGFVGGADRRTTP